MGDNLRRLIRWLEVPDEGTRRADRWYNNDIKPIERGRRTWKFWTFHNLWVLTDSNISSYLTGSSLIAIGLSWWQAIIVIVIGNICSCTFVVLNSVPGAYYHLGFPVVNRYIWGLYGSSFVIYNRILLSLVWYAVQAWIGGECVYVCLTAIWPSLEHRIPNHMPASTGMTTAQFVAYILFNIFSLPLIWIRPHKLRPFLYVSAITVLTFYFVLLIWALATMGPAGFGSTISAPSNPVAGTTRAQSGLGWTIIFGIISTIGSISAGILNQNDYARFAQRPRHAIAGQIVSAATYAILCSVIGILVTAATQDRFGHGTPLWNLPDLFTAIIHSKNSSSGKARTAAFFAGLALIVSQLGINIPGNALSGGFDLAATFPRFINIRRGAYITALLSIVCNPWHLLSSASTFLAVLSGYAVFLGPMIGLMITGYFLVHRRKIKVEDLYYPRPNHVHGDNTRSIYWFTWGINWRACLAWACGVAPSMPGFIASVNPSVHVPVGCTRIYYMCFLLGFAISSVVFVFLHTVFPAHQVRDFVRSSPKSNELVYMYRNRWDEEAERMGYRKESGSGNEDGVAKIELEPELKEREVARPMGY